MILDALIAITVDEASNRPVEKKVRIPIVVLMRTFFPSAIAWAAVSKRVLKRIALSACRTESPSDNVTMTAHS